MAKGCPAARVRTTREALDIPLVTERGMLQPTHTAAGRSITVMNAGYVTDTGTPGLAGPIPGLGQHTDEVLRELGFGDGDIERMRQTGAI
jgi:crotonobetainyl-CoA:carnitine CoA-transferase CaiB-like acyl-CoA transferase